jgi:hypothetical protein
MKMTNPAFARVSVALLFAGGVGVGLACEQPKILCNTGHGAYAVRYTLVEGTGACAMLKTGVIGVQAYGSIGKNMSPDWKRPPVALKTEEAGTLADSYGSALTSSQLSSVGRFATEHPGADGFCAVDGLTPVTMNLPAVPAMTDAMGMMTEPLPATSLQLTWSNVKFYVSPSIIGTEFVGDLTYVKDGCTAKYKVSGLYPSTSCADKTALGGINPGLCLPCKGGAGISPAIETVCDPEAKLCLPKTDVPSARTTPLMCPAPEPQPAPDAGTPAPTPDAGAADAGGDAGADAVGDTAGDATAG